ncbi:MAG: hypothetical protein IJW24_03060 [Clostridia bacterium]|nr:hypothetical protein [Clostridia bacterium]
MANEHLNYIYSIKGIAAKKAYFARLSLDDVGGLLDMKADQLQEWQHRRDAATSKHQREIYNEYLEHTYLDCCCCFVAMAEKLGVTEAHFTEKQKHDYEYRTWEAIEKQIIERGLYPPENGSSWGSSR